jgi:hypothetical protein
VPLCALRGSPRRFIGGESFFLFRLVRVRVLAKGAAHPLWIYPLLTLILQGLPVIGLPGLQACELNLAFPGLASLVLVVVLMRSIWGLTGVYMGSIDAVFWAVPGQWVA